MNKEGENRVNLNALYQDIIMDHNADPRNFGDLPASTCHAEGFNPMCGDRIKVALKLDENSSAVVDQKFSGEGCSICMASASMMTEEVAGLSLTQVLDRVGTIRSVMQNELPEENIEGDLEALLGVKKFPVRIKCALLPWTTLKQAVESCPLLRGCPPKVKKGNES